MDFLGSAALLIPALTGLAVTIYKEEQDILSQFESKYCFSSQIQKVYTASGLKTFCETGSEELLYELVEPLGSRLIAAKTSAGWFLLGPFVPDEWSEQVSSSLLIKLGLPKSAILPYKSYRCKLPISQPDFILKTALLIIGQLDGGTVNRRLKTITIDAGSVDGGSLTFCNAYEDASITNKRYNLELALIKAISTGEIEKVHKVMIDMKQVVSNIVFISDSLIDKITGAAALRSDVRMGAILGGLSPVLVDSISQEYAQQIQHAAYRKEVDYLIMRYIERICAEIREMRTEKYSMSVRKAKDYMEMNLSNPMDATEIAEAVGIDRRYLVRTFRQETGMTIKQYLAKSRCEAAADLLRSTHFSIQSIASYVGYVDNNYFTKVFKANLGVSPKDYRKAHWPSE